MDRFLRIKGFCINATIVLILGSSLSSCDKDADPAIIIVSSTPLPAGSGGGATTPGGGTTNPGGGTTNPGGGTTNPGGGTTNPGGGTTNPGTNTGGQGEALGASNTIIVKVSGASYTLVNPDNLVNFEVNSYPLVFTSVAAGTEDSEKSFALTSGATKAGLYDISLLAVKVNGIEYLASEGDGKVNYSKFDVTGEVNGVAKKGTLQGTYDAIATDINSGNTAHITGSFNITQP